MARDLGLPRDRRQLYLATGHNTKLLVSGYVGGPEPPSAPPAADGRSGEWPRWAGKLRRRSRGLGPHPAQRSEQQIQPARLDQVLVGAPRQHLLANGGFVSSREDHDMHGRVDGPDLPGQVRPAAGDVDVEHQHVGQPVADAGHAGAGVVAQPTNLRSGRSSSRPVIASRISCGRRTPETVRISKVVSLAAGPASAAETDRRQPDWLDATAGARAAHPAAESTSAGPSAPRRR